VRRIRNPGHDRQGLGEQASDSRRPLRVGEDGKAQVGDPGRLAENWETRYTLRMDSVGVPEILRIMAVTDALGFHREAIKIPLWTKGKGEILVRGQKLQISAPAEGDFGSWLSALPSTLKSMDLSAVRRA